MMYSITKYYRMAVLAGIVSLFAVSLAWADVVSDWSSTANNILVAAKVPLGGYSSRGIAIVQAAVYEAVNAITKRYPSDRLKLDPTPGASVEAAIAAANRATLLKLAPSQQAAIDKAYQAALATIGEGPAKTAGVTVGEQAAAAILAVRANDGAEAAESYRPSTTAGVYVPTNIPILSQWPQRKPWLIASADQFRPGPPPNLTSEVWARDYNEIKTLGAKNSATRTAEQTDIARFWEGPASTLYLPVVLSVTTLAGREVTQNARLLAVTTAALDDAWIAVMEAKYQYHFWRPLTAIRNGDADGNDATERDASWLPFIETPPHPEYPCAHCILAATVGTLLRAEIGTGPMPRLSTTSPAALGVERSWTQLDDFLQEVANGRIYDGVHFRTSTEVGTDMGKKLGEFVAAKYLQPLK
jgi:hypothetical protein